MPRPQRTRVASTRTVAKATSPKPVVMPSKPTDTESDIYDVSDREKEKSKHRRESMRDQNYTARTQSTFTEQPKMSESTHPQPPSGSQANQSEGAAKRRNSVTEWLDNATISSNRQDEDSENSDPSIEVGRRVAGTPQHRRMADMSGLDLDDDEFDGLNTTFDTAGPASAQRSDKSSMSASLFKRRPRAGSFLNREDGYIRPSSRAGPTTPGVSSTFNIGMFKRRAREPSILGTARKPRAESAESELEHEPEPELESELEDEDAVDEDGIAPEAESTPLRRSKARSGEAAADQPSPQVSTDANQRKRKSSEGHERRARTSPFEDDVPIEGGAAHQSDSDLSSPPSSPPLRRLNSRPVTPIMDEDLVAPPLSSSSSAGNSEIWPPLQSLARGRSRRPASALRRTPVANDNVSDMSSPPSLTYSPNYRESTPPPKQAAKPKRRTAASKKETQVTTADLAGLLPRRRRRNARAENDSGSELDMSDLGEDDDELAYLDVRGRRHPSRPSSRVGKSRNPNTAQGRATSRGKGKQAPTSANRRTTITYSRTSDKENQDEEVDDAEEGDEGLHPVGDEHTVENSQDMVARMGEELKNAARKFQEVDKWQLDYEEMTQSSSPRDAR
ncbi:hypothetical protein GGR54DRAFT_477065 [Hypoxylon sp. NC1633]|nr:hypothetical protein GGR54DRAFT_477065 [Hypoxylon sp. NC1633]